MSGYWRVKDGVDVSPGTLFADPAKAGGGPIGVELVIGQYGPDIAGVLRFFPNPTPGQAPFYDEPVAYGPPDFGCQCVYLHAGSFDSGAGTLSFATAGCKPGEPPGSIFRMRATGQVGSKGELTLTFTSQEPDDATPPVKDVVFARKGEASDLTSQLLQCPHPADAKQGNTANGL